MTLLNIHYCSIFSELDSESLVLRSTGIKLTCLNDLISYHVVTGGAESTDMDLNCGLPRGLSLEPLSLKFIAYAAGSRTVIEYRSMDLLTTRSSVNMLVNEIHAGKCTMIDCIADIELWCRSHGLKFNADKSDVIWLGTRQQLAMISQADKDLHLPSGTLRHTLVHLQ